MDLWGITHSGKVRSVNQDIYKSLVDGDRGIAILVVCDGMGGANAGNVASELAAEVFVSYISDKTKTFHKDSIALDDIADIVAEAAGEANAEVYKKSLTDIDCNGMGTTLVALVSTNDGEVVINIGDSRAYHITPNGITQITKDHSVVEDMIDRGEITRSQAEKHPRKNLITRAIGAEQHIESDVFTQKTDVGDCVLLCSDGLTNVVADEEILADLRDNGTLSLACESLLDKALSRGAPDNVTIAVFRKQEGPDGKRR